MTAARSRRNRANAAPQLAGAASAAPLDPAILGLARLIGRQIALEEIARRSVQELADVPSKSAGDRRGARGRRADHSEGRG